MGLADQIDELRLIDHHVHSVLSGPIGAAEFELLCTESDQPAPTGTSQLDSQLGFAIRRWCGPVLGLDPGIRSAQDYLAHRNSLPDGYTARTLLQAAGCDQLLVDTGYTANGSLSLAELGEVSGAQVTEVVRLESVAEQVALAGPDAGAFAGRFAEALWQQSASAAAVKSIVAYRAGLDVDPDRPSPREVTEAAGRWLREVAHAGQARLTDRVLLRHVLWAGIDRGLPVQLHTGFGDPDLRLQRSDPALASDFLAVTRTAGTPVVLLHCYPYHRQAGYLAQAYPHVYFDVGLALNYTGARAAAIVAEALELAPFGKLLYSSDAYGLPELVYLGARLWRRAVTEVLGGWVAEGHWTGPDASRVAAMVGRENAERLYRLPPAVAGRARQQ
jgi:predicted TIM-barrel fold metal-dependent hydrolase